ncbi:flagellar hook-associated protein FlgK [Psychromonas ingrahamii 37]|uniref:Flagellar hook-associated protein 1 n=1 Tax=Psychromonas ingrahamii (strain DSM 17664 / CCUG 51855 / 37) TaxID=357804 RepID=A1T0I7_PSYIN|nr:flagellar hook-associated protein FlgK [Psychromonas ingrahamii]ABM05252.1 flagellar hook-associated protein FlgK [Psychromonas ingrahamii 37]
MSIYNIALSGVSANRTALNITAQNIANANTAGHSRQQAVQSSITRSNDVGAGVEVSSIRRMADQFIISQLRSSNTELGNSSYSASSLGQLEQIVGLDGFNLSAGMDQFFSSISEASVAPESVEFRQQVLSDAQALAQRFKGLSQTLSNQNAQLASDRENNLSMVNGLLDNLAQSSKAIMEVYNVGGNTATLEDNRDQMLNELSQLIKVNVNKEENGELQLSTNNGQPLLINDKAAEFTTTPLPSDPYQAIINATFNGSTFNVSSDLGGELGAIDKTQKKDLAALHNTINEMAVIVADEVNKSLASGTDLNGLSPGLALFSYDPANPAGSMQMNLLSTDELAFSGDGNPGDGQILANLLDISKTDFSITGAGNINLSEAFSLSVGKIAIDSRQAQQNLDSNTALFNQVQASRENLSGVNSDEEAANLMIYANAYEANMKVISTANQMFNSILRAF